MNLIKNRRLELVWFRKKRGLISSPTVNPYSRLELPAFSIATFTVVQLEGENFQMKNAGKKFILKAPRMNRKRSRWQPTFQF